MSRLRLTTGPRRMGRPGRHSVVVALVAAVAGLPCPAADDFSSQALTTAAWKSLEAGDLEAALAAVRECRRRYAAEADRQQAGLDAVLPPERGHDAWALNDVGTGWFVEGQIHERAERKAEAVAAYRRLVDDYGFAQCWDSRGWFWRPADAASERLEVLEFDAALAE